MLVMPSDHYIPDANAFAAMAEDAAKHLSNGQIICFGITPDRPETGYGYIRLGDENGAILAVEAFTEKPDAETAEAFIEVGGYLWNAGIFMMRAGARGEVGRRNLEILFCCFWRAFLLRRHRIAT